MTVKVKGQAKVLANLNKQILKIKGRTLKGLYTAALLVKNRAVKITPYRLGNLAGSAYVTPVKSLTKPIVEIGYTAVYAPIVHEMPASYNYTKPGTGPKFLEKALRSSAKDIIEIIKKEAKIK